MEKICLKLFSLQKIKKNKSSIMKQPPEGFCKKGVLKKFHKIRLKHLCWRLFLTEFQVWGLQLYYKRDSNSQCFQVNFVKFLRTSFLQNTSVIFLTVSFQKVLYICSNLLLLGKWIKLKILLSFYFAYTFYTLYCECIL